MKKGRGETSTRIWLILATAVVALSFIGASARPAAALDLEKLSPKTLKSMLRGKEAVFIKGGVGGGKSKIGEVTGATYIPVPPEKVFDLVADLDRYKDFVPQCLDSKVVKSAGNSRTVEFEFGVTIGFLTVGTDYVMENVLKPPYKVEYNRTSGGMKYLKGTWEMIPVDDGKGTILVYKFIANLKSMSAFLDLAFKIQPDFEVGLQASAAALAVRAMRERAVKLFK